MKLIKTDQPQTLFADPLNCNDLSLYDALWDTKRGKIIEFMTLFVSHNASERYNLCYAWISNMRLTEGTTFKH